MLENLKNIEIKNFRGIKNLKINDLKKINFFFGEASSGKTSVLEAVYLYLGRGTKNIAEIMNCRRNTRDQDCVDGLFCSEEVSIFIGSNDYGVEIKKGEENIVYSSIDEKFHRKELKYIIQDNGAKALIEMPFVIEIGEEGGLEIEAKADNTKNIVYLSPFSNAKLISENVSKIINSGELDALNEYCKKFDDSISGIMMAENNSIKVFHKNKNKKPVNLKLMGDGFQAYLNYISSILAKNEVICIDGIENGLHFTHIDLILKIVLELAIKHNIQFFITTHSKELLEQLAKILDEGAEYFKNNVACFNLYKEDYEIKAWENIIDGFIANIKEQKEVRL